MKERERALIAACEDLVDRGEAVWLCRDDRPAPRMKGSKNRGR